MRERAATAPAAGPASETGTLSPIGARRRLSLVASGRLPADVSRRDVLGRLSGFLALTKPRIVELLLVTTVPAMVLAARGWPGTALVAETVVGGALAAGGANAANMVYDRDIDAVMGRTKSRPIVSGVVSATEAAVFAALLEVAAFALLATTVNLLAAALTLAAAVFYVGVYTMLLKRSTRQNIVIGGAAGAAPALVGWAAVTGHLALAPILLFGIVFLWTPPHFWALAIRYRDDYDRASVPMLPVVVDHRRVATQMAGYALLLTATTLALAPVARLGIPYAVVALVLGGVFVVRTWALRRDPRPERAMAVFHYSILYLALLFLAVGLDAAVRGH